MLKHGRGVLERDRAVEQVRSCGLLRAYRGKELETLFQTVPMHADTPPGAAVHSKH